MNNRDSCLAVMTKACRPGRIKTRLIPMLGSKRAARVAVRLLEDTMDRVCGCGDCDIQLWGTPDSGSIHMLKLSDRFGCRRYTQPRGDLGRKMSGIFSRLLMRYRQVIIIGGDCPEIDAAQIDACYQLLRQGVGLVLGAAEDGGYVLIGLSRPHPFLFRNIPWGTARVQQLTLRRARQQGLSVHILKGLWDVDRPADYIRWRRWLRDQGKAWVV